MKSFQTCIIYQNIVTNVLVNICGMYGGNEKCIQKFYTKFRKEKTISEN